MKCMVSYPDTLEAPPIGSIISVKHSGCLSSGVLNKPVFWRERKDVENSFEKMNKSALWTKRETHLQFFDQLKKKMKINDVLDWYKVRKQDVYDNGGKKLLKQYYNDSLQKV